MKRIVKSIFVVAIVTLSLTAFAQSDNRPVAVQAGTGHIVNGTCSIKLNEQTAANGYFVSITPAGPAQGLYVTKNDGVFVVKGKQTEKVDFDYVVFINVPARAHAGMLIQNRVPPSK